MAIFYPYSEVLPLWSIVASAAALIAISIIVVRARRRHPYLLVGWFWYVLTLVPVIGIVQVGTQAIADRYTYVPLVGIFILVAWGIRAMAPRTAVVRERALPAIAAVVVVLLAVVAHGQVNVWHNNESIWTHARAVTTGNYIAENELGIILVHNNQFDEALPYFERASQMKPEYIEARFNRGLEYLRKGRMADAIEQLTITTRLKPDHADAFNNLGFALMSMGRTDEALTSYQQAMRLKPDMVDAHNNAGFVLAAAGRIPEAIEQFQTAIRLAPEAITGHMYLGMAYGAASRLDEAAHEFQDVLRISPNDAGAREQLARVDAARRRGK
jgi:tetratricopeptide (TPR) repeat protein